MKFKLNQFHAKLMKLYLTLSLASILLAITYTIDKQYITPSLTSGYSCQAISPSYMIQINESFTSNTGALLSSLAGWYQIKLILNSAFTTGNNPAGILYFLVNSQTIAPDTDFFYWAPSNQILTIYCVFSDPSFAPVNGTVAFDLQIMSTANLFELNVDFIKLSPALAQISNLSFSSLDPFSLSDVTFQYTTSCRYLPTNSALVVKLGNIIPSTNNPNSNCQIMINNVVIAGSTCTWDNNQITIQNFAGSLNNQVSFAVKLINVQLQPSFLGPGSAALYSGPIGIRNIFTSATLPFNYNLVPISASVVATRDLIQPQNANFIIQVNFANLFSIPIGSGVFIRFLPNFTNSTSTNFTMIVNSQNYQQNLLIPISRNTIYNKFNQNLTSTGDFIFQANNILNLYRALNPNTDPQLTTSLSVQLVSSQFKNITVEKFISFPLSV